MLVDCLVCPLRAKVAFRPMAPDELDSVRRTKTGERLYPPRSDILVEGDQGSGIGTIFSGWALRYKTLRDGERQVLDILLPGDLVGLQSPLTGKLRHSVRAITQVRICNLDEARFHNLFKVHPALSEAIIATLLIEEQRADARLLLLGRQRPTERLGYFLLELRERLERRGDEVADGYDLPLTYAILADAIGVSRSQLAVSLRDLALRGWASVSDRRLTILDYARMSEECEYSPMPDPALRTLI